MLEILEELEGWVDEVIDDATDRDMVRQRLQDILVQTVKLVKAGTPEKAISLINSMECFE